MWLTIFILTLGTFAIGTDGFVIAGVLPDIANELVISIGRAGQLVTLFAVAYAVGSPLLASLTAHVARRRLLLSVTSIFVAANVLAAVTHSFTALAFARIVAALAAAAYTPTATVAAAMLAGDKLRGRALSTVLSGMTVATILGVPLGTWLARFGGYHTAFWLVSTLGILAFAGLWLWLPQLPSPPPTTLRMRLDALKLPGVSGTLLITLLAITAGFTVYTYIAPLLATTLPLGREHLSLILFVFGIAGALGNSLSGWLVDHWGTHRTTLLSLTLVTISLILLPYLATTLPGALLGVFIWNGAGWLLLPAQQHRLLTLATPHTGALLISLNASALYLGIASAGMLGGVVIKVLGTSSLAPVATAVEFVALIAYIANRYRTPVDAR